jgi:hypothetical protein
MLQTTYWKELVFTKMPPLAASLLVTDAYVHLGSFARECVVFLTLWFVLDRVYGWARAAIGEVGRRGAATR